MQTYTKRVDGKTELVTELKRSEVAALVRALDVAYDLHRVGQGAIKKQAIAGFDAIRDLLLTLGEGDSIPARDNS